MVVRHCVCSNNSLQWQQRGRVPGWYVRHLEYVYNFWEHVPIGFTQYMPLRIKSQSRHLRPP